MDKMTNNVKKVRTETNSWRELYVQNTERALNQISQFFTEEEINGFGKQLNRGKIAELYFQQVLGLYPIFDKISSYDFIYQGKRVQFKYVGQNSAPSVSELKRNENETMLKFVNRIMNFYKECDLFMITLENFITDLSKENVTTLTPPQFKKILMNHEVKIGEKLRLRKTITRKTINQL